MAKSIKGSEAKLQKYGIFFIIPFVVIYLFFQFWPTIYTVLLSFTDMRGLKTQGFHGTKTIVTKLSDYSNPEDDLEQDIISPLYTELEVLPVTEPQEIKEFRYAQLVTSDKIKQGNLLYDYLKKLARIRYYAAEKEAKKVSKDANVMEAARNRGMRVEDVEEVLGITVPKDENKRQKFILSKKFNLTENGINHTFLVEQEVVIWANALGKCQLDCNQFVYEIGEDRITVNQIGDNNQSIYEIREDGSYTRINAKTSEVSETATSVFTYNKNLTYTENGKTHNLLLRQLITLNHSTGKCLISESLYEVRPDGTYKIGDVSNGVLSTSKRFVDKTNANRVLFLEQKSNLKINDSTCELKVIDGTLVELANNKKVEVGKVSTDKNGDTIVKTKVCKSVDKDSPSKVTLDKATTKCGGVHFVGGTNFKRLFGDGFFWASIGNTFIMWLFNFIPQLGIALLFAIWFTDPRMHLKGKNAFRAMFYMPNLLTAASVSILFRSLFGYPTGPINQFLYNLGIQSETFYGTGVNGIEMQREAINFFRGIAWSRGIVSFIQWWLWCGQTLIMLMAGITSISPSLYESAVVDGANQSQQTWYITLPLLRPMMLYILITGLIGGMQLFEIPFLLTDMYGGPRNKIRTMVLYMYNQAFQGVNDYAYGAAVAMGVFVITMGLSMFIYFFMQDRSDMGRK